MRNTTLYKNIPKTFRRSSTSLITGQGGNLQNIEKETRVIYEPDGFTDEVRGKCKYWLETGDHSVFTAQELDELRVFLQVDQSGAEALIVAYDCEDGNYRKLFQNNIKVHSYVCSHLFKDIWRKELKEAGGLIEDFDIEKFCQAPIDQLRKMPYFKELFDLIRQSDDWPASRRYYYLGKQTCHSANYDIKAPHFRMNILEKSGGKIYISKDESERFLMIYRGLFPEIPERNRRVARQVEEHRMLYNMLGMPYIITNYNITDFTMKEYYAWGPQSTVGEITRIAYTNLQEFIEQEHRKWDNLADTHDSYLTQAPLLEVKQCRDKMQEYMNQELISPIDGTKFRMKSECNIGFNWAPKKENNLLGMQEVSWLN